MRKTLKKKEFDNAAQASIIGYALTICMCGMILGSSSLIMGAYLDQRNTTAAAVEAQSIANTVVSMITDAIAVKNQMPNVEYNATFELPINIASYSYYIEATDSQVLVISSNNKISESCSTYNAIGGASLCTPMEPTCGSVISVSGKVTSANKYLLISIVENNEIIISGTDK